MRRPMVWLGVLFLIVGLLGHVFAARAIGGYRLAYVHHIGGFFIIAIVTGLVIVGLARLFWRGRHGLTLLVVGVVQAVLGLMVYANTVG